MKLRNRKLFGIPVGLLLLLLVFAASAAAAVGFIRYAGASTGNGRVMGGSDEIITAPWTISPLTSGQTPAEPGQPGTLGIEVDFNVPMTAGVVYKPTLVSVGAYTTTPALPSDCAGHFTINSAGIVSYLQNVSYTTVTGNQQALQVPNALSWDAASPSDCEGINFDIPVTIGMYSHTP